jgi:hypothetical protein
VSLDRWGGFLSGFLKGRSRVPRRSPEMSPPGAGMAGREAELLLVFAWLLIWTVRLVFFNPPKIFSFYWKGGVR